MALQKIQLRPGIFREGTKYSNQGGWYDCDKIRFRSGLPEKMKGWVKNNSSTYEGTCRSLIQWSSLTGQDYIGLGTEKKYYVLYNGSYIDITPVVRTVTLAANQISATSGSNRIYIRDTGNTSVVGDYVTITNVTTSFGGIPAAEVAKEQVIVSVTNITDYTLSANPITTTGSSPNITFAWASNTLSVGQYVTIAGATGFDGLAAGDINGTRIITARDSNGFTVVAGASATSGATGGGSVVEISAANIGIDVATTATSSATCPDTPTLAYQLSVGLNTVVAGPGWGAGPWGGPVTTQYPAGVGWGQSYGSITFSQQLRLWTSDNYGQDLIINPRGGGIYYETESDISAGNRAVNITTFNTPSYAPTLVSEVAVFGPTRNVIAFACNPYGETTQDPMMIRWSASEDPGDWQPRADNDAGDFRLSAGSQFITHMETKQEIVIWTDIAAFSMKYVGPPFTFGLDQIGYGTSIIGPNAKIAVDDRVFWMGATAFFGYGGRIEQIPCTVKDYVFSNLNYSQAEKITCGSNVALGEVIWFYPSLNAQEVDRYVIYNYLSDVWYYGTLSRTAWLDFANNGLPIAAGTDSTGTYNILYNHETGYDDGSTASPSPIVAYIQSSPFEIGDGDSMMFVRQIYPDLTFRDSTVPQPQATFTLYAQNYPGAPDDSQSTYAQTVAVTSNINQFTQQVSLRMRGRSAAMRLQSSDLGVAWRIGVPRFEMRTDGRR